MQTLSRFEVDETHSFPDEICCWVVKESLQDGH